MIHSYFEVSATGKGIVIFKYIQIFFSQIVARIAVPLFFIISGYLLFFKYKLDYKFYYKVIKRKIKSLLVPFLIWNLAVFCFFFIIQKIPLAAKYSSGNLMDLSNLSFLKTLELVFLRPIANQFWFIRDLMLLVVISPFIKVLLNRTGIFLLLISFLLMIYFADTSIIQYFKFESFSFFVFGAYLSKKDVLKLSVKVNLLVCLSIFYLIVSLIETNIYFQTASYIYWLHYVNILLGVWVFWNSFLILNKRLSQKLYSLEKYAFIIYALHVPLNLIIYRIIISFLSFNFLSLLTTYIITITLSIFISLVLGYFLNKLCPNFYSVITGDRR